MLVTILVTVLCYVFSDITTQSKAVLCDILDDSTQVTNLIYMRQKMFLTVDGTESINELFVNYMYSLITFNSNSKRTRLQQEKSPSNTG